MLIPEWVRLPNNYTPIAVRELWEKPKMILIECEKKYRLIYSNYEEVFIVTTYVFCSEALGAKDLGSHYDTIAKHLSVCDELNGITVTPKTDSEEIATFLVLKALAR